MAPRILAVGDIHGCDVALDVMLERLALTAADTLIVLGDAIDRGPRSARVVERLLAVQESCRLVFLKGNHEEMMLTARHNEDARREWLLNGGDATLASYGNDLANVPAEHWQFLSQGLRYWETASDICVHANLEPGVPLDEQSTLWLRWQHLTGMEFPHPSGKRVICGHTGQRSGLPYVRNGWVCLDTLVHRGLFLTCLDLNSGAIHQTTQAGRYRSGVSLSDLAH